jgi:hypothetical protein
MTTRNYSSRSQQTTLTGAVTAGASTIVVQSGAALLGGQSIPAGTTFTIVVDPDTAIEEILDATAVSTNTFSVTRAIDGSSAQGHSAGAVVRHMAIGRDYRESNAHVEASTGVHGISNSSSVVGTIDTQTLTNKTLTAPTITNPNISGAGVDASIVFEGATPDAFETTLTVVDPTQDNTITMPNTTGTVVIATAVQTLTNKTLTSPTISGSPVITGLSSAGMSASSATPKDYVDSILGSATAAATSAASAATSAASAATSATSAATSATASASSATASASSATAAATSATSAAASATAAATSATSAANSATTAANSVATIAGYATSAANSATAAATSATSAATSASSALTSANSAATSASTMNASVTAAATSAASAAASATAAATSATSAAASATAANTSAINAAASESVVAASASAAATSATSASASATAAATSAASASTSASSALTSQTAAATSASSASTSASSALTSATSAATSYDEFDDRYLGAKSSAPTVDNDGNTLLTGALYWNTVSNKMFVWSGTAWTEISSSADIISYKYTVAGGATSVTGADDNGLTLSYTVGKEQVYINGVLQVRGSDYTASTGTSITGMLPLTASDIVTVLAFTAFVVANTYTIAQADATFIPDAIVDAKGDLIVATAADTVARLAAGTNGDSLVADSSTATGLRYQGSIAAGKNAVINGGFDIWQRGTSVGGGGGIYSADRWYLIRSGFAAGGTVSRQATGDTTNLPNIQYCARIQRDSGNTSTASLGISQSFETVNSIPYAGKIVTFSFYARKSATFSGNIVGLVAAGTGTDQNVSLGYSGFNTPISITPGSGGQPSLTTTWQRYTLSGTIPTTATEIAVAVDVTVSGTAGAADYVEIAGVQLELGSVATAFTRNGATIQGELVACQRYFQTLIRQATVAVGQAGTTSVAYVGFNYITPMRVSPTVALGTVGAGAGQFSFLTASATFPATIGTIAAGAGTPYGFELIASGFTGAFVAGNASMLYANGIQTIFTSNAEL